MDFRFGCADDVKISINTIAKEGGIELYELKVIYPEERIPERFNVSFPTPDIDMYSVWSPSVKYDRHLGPNWSKRTTSSRLASGMPIHSLVSMSGKNRVTVALSDAKTPISISTGVCEEDANIHWDINFFTVKVAPLKEYSVIIRIDTRDIAYYDAIYDVVTWWENDCGYTPAYVPEHAKLPMNSLWYSYHQYLDVDTIIQECTLAKALGMDSVILDDGWQTDDYNRGYQFCGDWEVTPTKIPDMKQLVDRIHDMGMKVVLWYSVPYVGKWTKAYTRFSSMMLDQTGDNTSFWSVDPRYKEVREYLIDVYSRALKEWGLDGLKLDFIDSFALKGKSLEYDARRDYQSLEEAVDTLMTDITDALRAINPEVLIEFRQTYVGPAIRKYGTMLRVSDCPNDAICNRQDIIDLRLTSGKTAVHSDPLMWHLDDTVEAAALQFINALYGVPQISVKLAKISEEHRKMLAFYLSFWRENRDILTEGKILAANPESAYSIVCAEKEGNAIFTAYTDPVIDGTSYAKIAAVNASRHRSLIIKGADGKTYKSFDCMGNVQEEGVIDGALYEIMVPLGGMIQIN